MLVYACEHTYVHLCLNFLCHSSKIPDRFQFSNSNNLLFISLFGTSLHILKLMQVGLIDAAGI